MDVSRQPWWRRPAIEMAGRVCAVATATVAAFWIVVVPALTNAYAASVFGGVLGLLGWRVWVRCLRDVPTTATCAIKAAAANALGVLYLEWLLLGMAREVAVTSWPSWHAVWITGMAAHALVFGLCCAVAIGTTIAAVIAAVRKTPGDSDSIPPAEGNVALQGAGKGCIWGAIVFPGGFFIFALILRDFGGPLAWPLIAAFGALVGAMLGTVGAILERELRRRKRRSHAPAPRS